MKKKRKVIYSDGPTDRDMQRTLEQMPLCFFYTLSILPAERTLKRFALCF